ncbi:Nicotinate catabolism cluster-specific transcription factor [Colletotrichum spinosum]|uniref:Nicotinate catabolism cluster-specific transcription factor n=1 Tax=Colletotrichum spinosum TaxID=1347390 RepID=A0A4R8PQY7_9PEZI|nr:Nicotinate catabolism cluster-specific transcription factor [Colletotrichum spinosum]
MHPERQTGNFSCPECSRRFNRVENLKRHQKTHQSHLPHVCDLCRRQFSRSDLLKKHRATHKKGGRLEEEAENEDANHGSKKRKFSFVLENYGETIVDPSITIPKPTPASRKGTAAFGQSPYRKQPGFEQEEPQAAARSFDFSSFMLQDEETCDFDTAQWFTADFYHAVQETTDHRRDAHAVDPCKGLDEKAGQDLWNWLGQVEDTDVFESGFFGASSPELHQPDVGSRDTSPPNVPSHEDAIAFAWNPSSDAIKQTSPISILSQHPLRLEHNARFDLTDATWAHVQSFLQDRNGRPESLTFPSYPNVNIFLGLFFEKHYEQTPVLHLPALNTNKLSPALLSIMVAIGATYSQIRHTRRFAILLAERARLNLDGLVGRDGRLTRDPETIYAYALLCYFGLWCGNKGAFEAAEALRGTLVTYARRLPKHCFEIRVAEADDDDVTGRWRAWIRAESRRRLCWFVFMIDSQFPAILNMKAMLSTAEVSSWVCPGDEALWHASTAESWAVLMRGHSGYEDAFFRSTAKMLVGLARMHLNTSISDIQGALGKGGRDAEMDAVERFKSSFEYLTRPSLPSASASDETPSDRATSTRLAGPRAEVTSRRFVAFRHAIEELLTILDEAELQSSSPYSTFGVFLNYVLLWMLVKTSSDEERADWREHVTSIHSKGSRESELQGSITLALGTLGPGAVLVQAAQSLARLGTWGASLNLALLLELRAKR